MMARGHLLAVALVGLGVATSAFRPAPLSLDPTSAESGSEEPAGCARAAQEPPRYVWFDSPNSYELLEDVTGPGDDEECIKKCASTSGCGWAGRYGAASSSEDAVCRLQKAVPNELYPSAVLVRSPDEDHSVKLEELEARPSFTVYPVPENWCILAEFRYAEGMDKCKEYCQNIEECGRVTLNKSGGPNDGLCHLQQVCGWQWGIGSPFHAVQEVERHPTRDWVEFPADVNCMGDRVKDLEDVSSLAACEAICEENPECSAVAFDAEASRCHLWEECTSFSEGEGTASAALLAPEDQWVDIPTGYKCADAERLEGHSNVTSLDYCKHKCDKHDGCKSVSWNPDTNKCHLDDGCGRFVEETGTKAAIKAS